MVVQFRIANSSLHQHLRLQKCCPAPLILCVQKPSECQDRQDISVIRALPSNLINTFSGCHLRKRENDDVAAYARE